jgi:glycerophosphoryl diester phosphodiesterase
MPYTFRNENEFLPAPLRRGEQPGQPPQAAPRSTYGDAFAEYAQYRALGVEGLFSDNGDTAISAFAPT